MQRKLGEAVRQPAAAVSSLSTARRNYILLIMLLVGVLNYLDRQIITILIEPIRHEFSLSDSELGLLTGIAFTIVYVVMGVPAARLADRWSRRKVVGLALLIWSVATTLCGAAQNFIQLFALRMGVGVGEAGGSAPSQALIGDLFRREQRTTAMSLLLLAMPIGMATGLMLGGWAAQQYGWRTAFLFAGLPGLLLAPLIFLTVPETQKGLADGVSAIPPQSPFLDTVRLLWTVRSLRNMIIAATMQMFLSLGFSTWMPAFLARSHGLSSSAIGFGYGLAMGIGFAASLLVGGRSIDVMGRRDVRWHFWIPMVAILASGCFALAAFLAPTSLVFVLVGFQIFTGSLNAGAVAAIPQALVPVQMRATALACVFFFGNSLALSLGPQVIGMASDLFRPALGEESLRAALETCTIIAIPSAIFYFLASRTYAADIEEADRMNQQANA